jgi:hypothetical protein
MTWSLKLWRAWQSSSTWRWSGSQTSAPTSEPSALDALGTMSPTWRRDQIQRHRVVYDGVAWAWPIRKDRDE